jgi:hypothetical protein
MLPKKILEIKGEAAPFELSQNIKESYLDTSYFVFEYSQYNTILLCVLLIFIYVTLFNEGGYIINFLILFIFFSINAMQSRDFVSLYISYEFSVILIYLILGLNSKYYLNFKATMIYYLISFISSLISLCGLFMVTNSELTALIFFISLIIKLGSFPFYG